MKCEDDQRVGPIISYLKKSREKSKSVKAAVDARSGKILSYKEARIPLSK